ncbi:MAG: hypothetical protein CTY18_05965 [Methylomonas sp.]|nr:MAG: hypothetical protein CTY18_05965 [Methylomonas sp.]
MVLLYLKKINDWADETGQVQVIAYIANTAPDDTQSAAFVLQDLLSGHNDFDFNVDQILLLFRGWQQQGYMTQGDFDLLGQMLIGN